MSDAEDICARDGCNFHVEIDVISGTLFSTVYCGDACADYEWFRRTLESADLSPGIEEALRLLNELERVLNARSEPFEVGPLLGSLYA
ncbi:hypothetical protein [Streptomyces griseofuscus]|uniref:Uncharacterized protein n=1 Tax=Streptomyces griseofuscus TaxID=146922 RepID=A0A426SFR0_9ACTN|nr:hypothetical protein [Streptomyces griseofuscus]RRQ89704.1 hypothetical protein CQW44_03695 [Streptomyces griseofuscus]